MGTQQLWVIIAEMPIKLGDLPSEDTKRFSNVVTWANSPKTAQPKVSEVVKSYQGVETLAIRGDQRLFNQNRGGICDG